jgi:hypothetical protein
MERELTEKVYEEWIPPCCKLQTFRDHADYLLLCWGLLVDIKRGIYVRDCSRSCDEHINHDTEILRRILNG